MVPVYKCPRCGRTVERPEGTYYCSVCGPSTIMVKRGLSREGVKEVIGSEIHIRFYPEPQIVNADTGEVIKIEEGKVVRIIKDKITEALIHPTGLITIYGFPAKISVEPYYG